MEFLEPDHSVHMQTISRQSGSSAMLDAIMIYMSVVTSICICRFSMDLAPMLQDLMPCAPPFCLIP